MKTKLFIVLSIVLTMLTACKNDNVGRSLGTYTCDGYRNGVLEGKTTLTVKITNAPNTPNTLLVNIVDFGGLTFNVLFNYTRSADNYYRLNLIPGQHMMLVADKIGIYKQDNTEDDGYIDVDKKRIEVKFKMKGDIYHPANGSTTHMDENILIHTR